MALYNTSTSYGSVSRALHWSIAVLIIGMLAVGKYMADLPMGPLKMSLVNLHKGTGIVVLALVVVRVLWWLGEIKPALVKTVPARFRPVVNFGHYILYAFMVFMPLSGWIFSNAAGYPVSVYGLFTLPSISDKNTLVRNTFVELHGLVGDALIILLCLHVAAALVHHFWFRDVTLTRMLTGAKGK